MVLGHRERSGYPHHIVGPSEFAIWAAFKEMQREIEYYEETGDVTTRLGAVAFDNAGRAEDPNRGNMIEIASIAAAAGYKAGKIVGRRQAYKQLVKKGWLPRWLVFLISLF